MTIEIGIWVLVSIVVALMLNTLSLYLRIWKLKYLLAYGWTWDPDSDATMPYSKKGLFHARTLNAAYEIQKDLKGYYRRLEQAFDEFTVKKTIKYGQEIVGPNGSDFTTKYLVVTTNPTKH